MKPRGAEALGLRGRWVGLFLPAAPEPPAPSCRRLTPPPASDPPTACSLAEDPEEERGGGPGGKSGADPRRASEVSALTNHAPPSPASLRKAPGSLDFTERRLSRSGHLVPCAVCRVPCQALYTWPLDPTSFYKLIN